MRCSKSKPQEETSPPPVAQEAPIPNTFGELWTERTLTEQKLEEELTNIIKREIRKAITSEDNLTKDLYRIEISVKRADFALKLLPKIIKSYESPEGCMILVHSGIEYLNHREIGIFFHVRTYINAIEKI